MESEELENQEIDNKEVVNETTESVLNTGISEDLQFVNDFSQKVRNELSRVIVGQKEYVTGLLLALLTDGHVLIEGVPGIAKTLTARLMAKTLDVGFKRIQFTPDLMPADVTGTSVFNAKTADFEFKKGPIFSNFILIDEINRAPAKTQSSLFEVMEERQVTVDGNTYNMEEPFIVMATQNPIEQEGTYKLPEAQQDRFMFRLIMEYPSQEEELDILKRFEKDFFNEIEDQVQNVIKVKDLKKGREIVSRIKIGDDLMKYIADVIHNTRSNPDLFLGASPRASLAIMKSAKAMAALSGRDFVTPDDIKHVSYPVLNHRLQLNPEREMEGVELRDVLNNILEKIEIPR
jgi:MoxR-like ATPase